MICGNFCGKSIDNKVDGMKKNNSSRNALENAREREWIRLCQEGSREAFNFLFNRYYRDVYSMAFRMVNKPEVAEEITQEVFLSIYRDINKFQFQSAFTTWVYRIVHRRTVDYFRKNKQYSQKIFSIFQRNEEDQEFEVEDRQPGPLDQTHEKEKEAIVEKAIQSLNEKQREIIILRYVHQLSYEEIAEIMRCRLGTVKSGLNRAHKSLQQMLDPKEIF